MAAVAATALAGGIAYGAVSAASDGSGAGQDEAPPVVTVDEQTTRFFDEMPSRIGVLDRAGKPVGTVAKEEVDPRSDASHDDEPYEVLDDAGTLVGHMWPGIGFVSLGEAADPTFDPEALRQAAPTTTVVGPAP